MTQQKRISILTVTDNHYLILLAALVKSIEVNHLHSEIIDLYVVGDQITKANKIKFNTSFNPEKINIIWHNMRDVIPKSIIMPKDRTSYPLNIYMRLVFPWIISQNVERILYLDVDMIVLKDISELYHTDLGEHFVGAVQDPKITTFGNSWGGIKNYKQLGLDADTSYFNTGLLLIDVKQWHEQHITQKVIDCIGYNKAFLNYPDQYGLNVVLANKWQKIDSRWNTFSSETKLTNDPCLIHYAQRKPIYKSYTNSKETQDLFFHYLHQTNWSDAKLLGEFFRYFKKLRNVIKKWVFLN